MASCPEYLKQHVYQYGITATIDHLLEVAQQLRARRATVVMSYEADERDHYLWAKYQRECEALQAAKAVCE